MHYKVGYNSQGALVTKEVLTCTHFFVSYLSPVQIKSVFLSLLVENKGEIAETLIICREDFSSLFSETCICKSYITDNPVMGTIKNRTRLFTAPYKTLVKRKQIQKGDFKPILILIEDIWQLVPKLTRSNSIRFKDLLINGPAFDIYLIIGSTMPYRNLLKQLMVPVLSNANPAISIGTELIITPDEMIFFRENGELNFNSYYPSLQESIINGQL